MSVIDRQLSDAQIQQLNEGNYITISNTNIIHIALSQGVDYDTGEPSNSIYWLNGFVNNDCIEVIEFTCNDLTQLDIHKLLKDHIGKLYKRLHTLLNTDLYDLYSQLDNF